MGIVSDSQDMEWLIVAYLVFLLPHIALLLDPADLALKVFCFNIDLS